MPESFMGKPKTGAVVTATFHKPSRFCLRLIVFVRLWYVIVEAMVGMGWFAVDGEYGRIGEPIR